MPRSSFVLELNTKYIHKAYSIALVFQGLPQQFGNSANTQVCIHPVTSTLYLPPSHLYKQAQLTLLSLRYTATIPTQVYLLTNFTTLYGSLDSLLGPIQYLSLLLARGT